MGYNERIEVEGCDTIPKLFWHQVKARGERTAFREKDLGIWRATSWREYGERATAAGMGLVKFGLSHGEVVSMLAETVPEWLYVDMGTMARGRRQQRHLSDRFGQAGRVHPERQPHALPVRRERGAARQVPRGPRALPRPRQGLRLRHGGPGRLQRPDGHAVRRAARRSAARYDKANPGLWEKLVASSRAEELAILVYTSGTTGPPKGAMLSHRNVIFQLSNADAFIPIEQDGEQLAFLPLCHVAERTFTAFLPLRSGAIANFAESVETVPDNIREVAPTTFFAVPRIWERFYSGIAIRMKEATWIGRAAYKWAIGLGLKVAEAELDGRKPGPFLKLGHAIADWLVLDNIKRAIGMHRVKLRRHRRRADRARPDQVVPRARRRHARGLRPDRELRPGDRHARPHQARHRRRHRAAHRDRRSRPRARSCSRARTSSWAT